MFKYQSRTDFIDELIEINSKNEHFDQQVRNYKNIKTNHINLKKYHFDRFGFCLIAVPLKDPTDDTALNE